MASTRPLFRPPLAALVLNLDKIQLQISMSLITICLSLWFHENAVTFVPRAHWYLRE